MRTVNHHPDWRNEPLRLASEEKAFPRLVIEEFFSHFHLDDARTLLWDWLTGAMASSHQMLSTPEQRANMIFFYEQLESLIEASFLMKSHLPLPREQDDVSEK